MTGITHGWTRAGDVNLHYIEAGQGDPLVLVHGFPQHSYMWQRIMPALAERYRVVAIDQRGMGGSTITRDGYDKRSLAYDLAALCDALNLHQINLVGYDLGGGTAYAFASEWPARVRRLAVLEYAPPGYGYEYGMQPVRNWQSWQLAFFTQPDVAVQFIQGRERELLSWYFWHWSHNPDAIGPEDFERYVRELQKPGALRAGFEHFAAVFDDTEQVRAYAKSLLPMPVLALGGERGAASFGEQAFQRLATSVEGHVIAGAGHWLVDEQPELLTQHLMQFFGGT